MRTRTRKPTHPGTILKEHYIVPSNLNITEVAEQLHVSRKTISKILNGRGDITPVMALRLAQAFDTTPELWLNLQQNFDLWHARQDGVWKSIRKLFSKTSSSPSMYPVAIQNLEKQSFCNDEQIDAVISAVPAVYSPQSLTFNKRSLATEMRLAWSLQ